MNFKLRARDGSDAYRLRSTVEYRISIHAPVKGATIHTTQQQLAPDYFNPRSREGSDPYDRWAAMFKANFNPRSREGSDALVVDSVNRHLISIHAPVKGAT